MPMARGREPDGESREACAVVRLGFAGGGNGLRDLPAANDSDAVVLYVWLRRYLGWKYVVNFFNGVVGIE
jgi:hypothetical protein